MAKNSRKNHAAVQNHPRENAHNAAKSSANAAPNPAAQNATQPAPTGYRPNAAAIVVSADYPFVRRVLLAHRIDIKREKNRDAWQFVQGGIDSGESAREAVLREIGEELGTREADVIAECGEEFAYDFPPELVSRKKTRFRGQRQRFFLVRLRAGAHIELDKFPDEQEFDDYKFVSVKNAIKEIMQDEFNFKKHTYCRALEYFENEGLL